MDLEDECVDEGIQPAPMEFLQMQKDETFNLQDDLE